MQTARDFRYWLTWAAASMRTRLDEPAAVTLSPILGVSARSIRRWEAENKAPRWAIRVLMMLADGIPVTAGSTWNGWRFVRQAGHVRLCGPDGSTWSPADLESYGLTWSRLRSLESSQAPGAQLTWTPPGAHVRIDWPGGAAPSWRQLEEALRAVLSDAELEARRRS